MKDHYNSFPEFYTDYLLEHQDKTCRLLHFIGSSLIIALLILILFTKKWVFLMLLPPLGYGFAWAGHVFFERNKPATLRHGWYSFLGDWMMFKDIIQGNVKL
ncbi:MAG: DUF962 domain-containing protein [Cyanobacteria bacterium P01_A01_bin.83]